MTQEMCVLPVQCKGCGAVFDLYYDLQRSEEGDGEESGMSKALQQSLCWRCRRGVFEKLQGAMEVGEIADENEFLFEYE